MSTADPPSAVENGDVVVNVDIHATEDIAHVDTPVLSPLTPSAVPVQANSSGNHGDKYKPVDYKTMIKDAQIAAERDRLGGGSKSFWKASMKDIGALGIGLQLYFMLTKYLSVGFLIMGIISLPTIIVNYYGNGITSKMVDPLQLAYASLGNQGVNAEIASDASLCMPRGEIDCNWTTVDTPFASDPYKIAWLITVSDCLYSLVFLFVFAFYRYKAHKAIETHMNENLTPAKYAVFVRGLPPDATEKEVLDHFNRLYDLTKEEEYYPLWFSCCWGRRRKVKRTQSRNAVNRSTVQNLDHLAGTTSITKELYLNTWIAEVSIGHPTGGLLSTFLSMEALTQSIAETRDLILQLEQEKKQSLTSFKKRDEKLIHSSKKKLDKLVDQLEKKKLKIKALKHANDAIKRAEKAEKKRLQLEALAKNSKKKKAQAKVAAAASAARAAATATKTEFDWEACECAFVVFNNLESRRRCLQDYRASTRWLPHKFQPSALRFRNGKHRLVVTPAPEPSNILWENLEITDRGRFYRRSFTNLVTFLLLLASAMVISAAQSAQQQFKDKMPPPGLCDTSLPEVFYGNASFETNHSIKWNLVWSQNQSCAASASGKPRYHIAYVNGIVNPLYITNAAAVSDPSNPPTRCTDPCISETDEVACSTMPCFDQDLQDDGEVCESYQASHVLYCLCTAQLTDHIASYGLVDGAQRLWTDVTPCRGFIKDYLQKNGFIVGAAAVVVVVNMLLNMILRFFADIERHSSESAKATAIAMKMFLAQFLNTAIIVLLVNASLGLEGVPVLKELLKGKYNDFERDWYPSVGMGITTTMLINAFTPQILLCLNMAVVAPLRRCLSRRSIRTQAQMNKLYAGPPFDISVRYPMVLNSLFVTMVFSGGSPILLFIAAVTAWLTYCFDKLSILHLYSVKTAYDEELGELALLLLPWTLIAHLAFSVWMYGNTQLMKSTTIDLPWLLKRIGFKSLVEQYGDANSEALYNAFLEKASQVDLLGKYGFVAKVVRSNVMLIFLFLVGAVASVLLFTLWLQVVYPLLAKLGALLLNAICGARNKPLPPSSTEAATAVSTTVSPRKSKAPPPPVILPEYTDVFRKSVKPSFRSDTAMGFRRNEQGELMRVWQVDTSINGVPHKAGEPMRTWEAMQAPVKSYAIEMNHKYCLAVAEISAASKLLRMASESLKQKTIPVPHDEKGTEAAVMDSITATEPVSVKPRPRRARQQSSSSSSSEDDKGPKKR